MSQHKLVIAEKPSVAASLSRVLGANERKDGHYHGNGYIVSWCVGHLVELAQAAAYDEKYQKWSRADLPILPANWQYVVSKGKEKQVKTLRALMALPEVDTVVCATDAGREGQLIFQLVYDHCGCTKPVKRLWISSMEESAIVEGFANLRDGSEYENLYHAALCRAQADWLVGINGTRLFSCHFGQTLNVGRVMTPTLAPVVNREAEISGFTATPFYSIKLDLGEFEASSEKMEDKTTADALCAACDGQQATVESVKQQDKSISPPKLYDLTTLQRDANRLLGFTAQQTLDYAQSLYEKKLLTYPRTDSRFLTKDMEDGLPALVAAVAFALPFAKGLQVPVNAGQVVNDTKVSDHHALIPTSAMPKADLSALPSGEAAVLMLVAARLLCAVGDKHQYAETVVEVVCGGAKFTAKGHTVQADGWKSADRAFLASLKNEAGDEQKNTNKALPHISEGEQFIATAKLHEGKTSPPSHLTEDTLLAAMEHAGSKDASDDAERKGLGTPATRAGILEKLVRTGYVERKTAKKATHLLPTAKGTNLAAVVPESIQSPALTAQWEEKLKQVEHGALAPADFMEDIATMTSTLVETYEPPDGATALFPSDREVVGVCPRCGGQVVENKKGFACEKRECGFAIWKNSRFFTAKKKAVTKQMVAALLKDGRVALNGCHSGKTGKKYDAVAVLDDSDSGFVNFTLEFPGKAGSKNG